MDGWVGRARGERRQPDSERFRSDPRTSRSGCDRLSMEQDRHQTIGAMVRGVGHCSANGRRITMQMQQVQYFLALCEELNFSRAARRCGVSQPSLSTAVSALERELGGALLHRKAFDRLDRARARGAALPGRNRAQCGSRPRGCTDVDTTSGRRPISPASGGQFGAPSESMPNGWRLAVVCKGCGGCCDAQQRPHATVW
jgi:hypothetical protein